MHTYSTLLWPIMRMHGRWCNYGADSVQGCEDTIQALQLYASVSSIEIGMYLPETINFLIASLIINIYQLISYLRFIPLRYFSVSNTNDAHHHRIIHINGLLSWLITKSGVSDVSVNTDDISFVLPITHTDSTKRPNTRRHKLWEDKYPIYFSFSNIESDRWQGAQVVCNGPVQFSSNFSA